MHLRKGRGSFSLLVVFGMVLIPGQSWALFGFFDKLMGKLGLDMLTAEQKRHNAIQEMQMGNAITTAMKNYKAAMKTYDEIKDLSSDIQSFKDTFTPQAMWKREKARWEEDYAALDPSESAIGRLDSSIDKRLGKSVGEKVDLWGNKVIDKTTSVTISAAKGADKVGGPLTKPVTSLDKQGTNLAAKIWREDPQGAVNVLEDTDPNFAYFKDQRRKDLRSLKELEKQRDLLWAKMEKAKKVTPQDQDELRRLDDLIAKAREKIEADLGVETQKALEKITRETSPEGAFSEAKPSGEFSFSVLDHYMPENTSEMESYMRLARKMGFALLGAVVAGFLIWSAFQGASALLEAIPVFLLSLSLLMMYPTLWKVGASAMSSIEKTISVKSLHLSMATPAEASVDKFLGPEKFKKYTAARKVILDEIQGVAAGISPGGTVGSSDVTRIDKLSGKLNKLDADYGVTQLQKSFEFGVKPGILDFGAQLKYWFFELMSWLAEIILWIPAMLRMALLNVVFVSGPILLTLALFPPLAEAGRLWLKLLLSAFMWGLGMRIAAVVMANSLWGAMGAASMVGAVFAVKLLPAKILLQAGLSLATALLVPLVSLFASGAGGSIMSLAKGAGKISDMMKK